MAAGTVVISSPETFLCNVRKYQPEGCADAFLAFTCEYTMVGRYSVEDYSGAKAGAAGLAALCVAAEDSLQHVRRHSTARVRYFDVDAMSVREFAFLDGVGPYGYSSA